MFGSQSLALICQEGRASRCTVTGSRLPSALALGWTALPDSLGVHVGKKLVSRKRRRLSLRFNAGQDTSHRSGDYGAGGWTLGLGPPCLPFPHFRPLACDVHPVIYEEVSGDHGLVSGQHDLLQEVRAEVLLHPGILERERAKGRRCCEARAPPGRLPMRRGPQGCPSPQL